jgi:hypothetical protein
VEVWLLFLYNFWLLLVEVVVLSHEVTVLEVVAQVDFLKPQQEIITLRLDKPTVS